MKLYAPDKCPFCKKPLVGGSLHQAFYKCGAHVWIEWDEQLQEWRLKGHPGTCKKEKGGFLKKVTGKGF